MKKTHAQRHMKKGRLTSDVRERKKTSPHSQKGRKKAQPPKVTGEGLILLRLMIEVQESRMRLY